MKNVYMLLGVILCAALLPVIGSAQNRLGNGKVTVLYPIKHDISRPLREIIPVPILPEPENEHPVKPVPHPLRNKATMRDLALQSSTQALLPVTNSLNFAGVGITGGYFVSSAPPDTNGSIGATQYVQWVNTGFAVFDKTTGNKIYPTTEAAAAGNTLWSGFGGRCETNNDGDPIAQYDKAANRWVMTQFAVSGGPPFLQCVAVSTTSDATGSYSRYAFGYLNFNDYPKLGVWPDAYYISYNMFDSSSNFIGSQVCAFDRSKMLAGQAATQQCFQLNSNYGGLLPSDLDGTTPPPAGSPNYFLSFDTNSLDLWKFHVDWANPNNTTLTGPVNLPVAAFNPACNGGTCIQQPNPNQQLDSLGDRLMYRLAYRNFGDHESLVVNHSVDANGTVGVRWYELRNPGGSPPTVYQQGTFAPNDTLYRWMGSIAMDKVGNIAMGYSLSNSSVFPSIRFTGRVPGDTLGTMEAETSIIDGAGSQSPTLRRWGDYSNISVDPVDDCTMWYTNEYLTANGKFNWSTRISSFKFATCQAGSQVALKSITLSSPLIIGGCQTAVGTVTLNSVAPTGGAVVQLTNTNGAATAPASVTVPAGKTSATFVITTTSVTTAQTGTVTASYGGVSQGAALKVRPVQVKTLALSPNPVVGGNIVTATVTLDCTDAVHDTLVTLGSYNPTVAKPAVSSITIPKGTRTGTFSVTTSTVSAASTAKIKATANGPTVIVSLTVNP